MNLIQDLRYAFRSLRRKPTFTAAAVACLALGIGANSAIFSVVSTVMLEPLPFPQADRLVRLYNVKRGAEVDRFGVTPLNFDAWSHQITSFSELAAIEHRAISLTGTGDPERLDGSGVSASFFPAMGVDPLHGRTFTADEDQPGGDPVVVISYSLWHQRFAADPDLVGKAITLNGLGHTVIGVMPEGFTFPEDTQVWVPLALDPSAMPGRLRNYLRVVARLAPEASVEAASTELDALSRQLERRFPQSNTDIGALVVPLREHLAGPLRPALMLLLAAVGLMLLIACANVANLFLARTSAQSVELAMLSALGATRRQLVRRLFAEGILLAVIGGLIGLGVAYWVTPVLSRLSPANVPQFQDVRPDLTVLVFTLAISILVGVAASLLPFFKLVRFQPQSLLKHGGYYIIGARKGLRMQRMLVVFEVAIAVVLLISTGLLLRSFKHLVDIDPGFQTAQRLALRADLPASRYDEPHRRTQFVDGALARLQGLPQVARAAVTSTLPIGDRDRNRAARFSIENQPPQNPTDVHVELYRMVTPKYFDALGVPLLEGRGFTDLDHADAPLVALVSRSMADLYWPGESAVNKRLKRGTYEEDVPWITVVGVVADVRDSGLEEGNSRIWYLPYAQNPTDLVSFVLQTDEEDPTGIVASAKAAIWKVDPELPVHRIETLSEVVSGSVSQQRFKALLLTIFSLSGLILAAVGLYGLLSYVVNQRVREIGVRMALGAPGKRMLQMVVGNAFVLTGIGIALGIMATFVARRVISGFLFQVDAADPLTLVTICLILVIVALLASFVPARRAVRVDPTTILRQE